MGNNKDLNCIYVINFCCFVPFQLSAAGLNCEVGNNSQPSFCVPSSR